MQEAGEIIPVQKYAVRKSGIVHHISGGLQEGNALRCQLGLSHPSKTQSTSDLITERNCSSLYKQTCLRWIHHAKFGGLPRHLSAVCVVRQPRWKDHQTKGLERTQTCLQTQEMRISDGSSQSMVTQFQVLGGGTYQELGKEVEIDREGCPSCPPSNVCIPRRKGRKHL
jgi:hypothetical protein